MRIACSTIATAALLTLLAVRSPAHAQSQRAVLDQILDLYRTHDAVLLGEQHDGLLSFDFRMALLRHPRFASIVQDIVLECANSLYQQTLDDFVLRLQDVPAEKLRMVWRNTTMPTGVWDPPIYEEFIRAVRALNASLPPVRRIRLVAGDPPVDWAAITEPEQCRSFLSKRDETAYTAIEKESLQKHRKALVIYGGGHLVWTRITPSRPADAAPRPQTVGTYLRAKYPGRTYTIIPLSARYKSVDEFQAVTGIRAAPFLLKLEGSEHAALSARRFFGYLREAPVGDMMDAILFFGSAPDQTVDVAPDVQNDTAYQTELKRRLALLSRAFPPPTAKK